MDEPDIVCEGLVRIFAVADIEVQALQGLDLTVERGELVALVGASGSGKSTLLSILSALDTPTAGTARVAGRDLPALSARDRVTYRREIVGFVWQQTARNLLPYLSAKENVQLARAIGGDRTHPERALDLLELTGVADAANRRPAELSGGQQQRVAIAVALANDPRVLLADEPTGDLDEHASAEVLATFEAVNRELGTTALIVTHDPAVSEHVQRTVQIRDGRTSTEVLRWTHTDDEGQEHAMAEEFVVLDRVGRMQLPTDYMQTLELRDRVRLELNADHVGVWRGDTRAPTAGSSAPGGVPGAVVGSGVADTADPTTADPTTVAASTVAASPAVTTTADPTAADPTTVAASTADTNAAADTAGANEAHPTSAAASDPVGDETRAASEPGADQPTRRSLRQAEKGEHHD